MNDLAPMQAARLRPGFSLPERQALPPGEGHVRLRATALPFLSPWRESRAQAGLTIAEILGGVGVPGPWPGDLRVFLGDSEIPRAQWHRVRPKPGTTIYAKLVPQGGGDNAKATRTILQIGAIIANAIPGFGQVVSLALLAAAALVPVGSRKLDELGDVGSTSPFLTGGGNEVRQWAPVPRVLGTHREVPALLAPSFTEMVGNDQYVNFLFGGLGPAELSEFKLGETDLGEFSDVELETRQGFPGETVPALFRDTVIEAQVGTTLTKRPMAGCCAPPSRT